MFPWSHRLYAIVLRRVLAPFLDDVSLAQLHRSLELSFTDGKLMLRNVGLDAEKIMSQIPNRDELGIRLVQGRINRLDLAVALEDRNDESTTTTTDPSSNTTSFAWRAVQLGSASSKVALVVTLVMDGLSLVVEPISPHTKGESSSCAANISVGNNHATISTSPDAKTSSSYLDAILSSLRLSVQLTQLSIRLETKSSAPTNPFVELRVKSIDYLDQCASPPPLQIPADSVDSSQHLGATTTPSETILHKGLEMTRISIVVGQDGGDSESASATTSTTIALLDGGKSRITLRATESKPAGGTSSVTPRIQQDVRVSPAEKLQFFFNAVSLRQIDKILQNLESWKQTTSSSIPESPSQPLHPVTQATCDDSAEEDERALEDILKKQYQEARLSAERQEIRGGLLLPANDDVSENGELQTFDVFFDANDQSFYRYSVMLGQSQAVIGTQSADSFVHTQFRCHLPVGTIKIVVKDAVNLNGGSLPDEYILLTLTDLEMSSSLSSDGASAHSLSIAHIDMEDAHNGMARRTTIAGTLPRIQIGRMLTFPPTSEEADLLVQAPCLSMYSTVSSTEARQTTNVEIDLEPFVFCCPPRVINNGLALISKAFPSRDKKAPSPSQDDKDPVDLQLRVSCPHFDVAVPVDLAPRNWSPLFDRCGLQIRNSLFDDSMLGVHVERLEVQVSKSRVDTLFEIKLTEFLLFGQEYRDRSVRLVDIAALSGITEPICLRVVCDDEGMRAAARATDTFPRVPALSSFKAVQEDDEDGDEFLPTPSDKEMRGYDPQPHMREALTKAVMSVELVIPTFSLDVSTAEVNAILAAVRMMKFEKAPQPENTNAKESKPSIISVSCTIQNSSIGVRGSDENQHQVFLLSLSTMATSLLIAGGKIQQSRLLWHNIRLCALEDKRSRLKPRALRSENVKQRHTVTDGVQVSPILHRSALFVPISRESPVMLVDMLDDAGVLSQKSVYVTFYDITYRFDYESAWIPDLKSVLDSVDLVGESEECVQVAEPSPTNEEVCITRVVVCIADCNVDYTSPQRYCTAARLILRVGELRFASNVIQPSGPQQAIRLSIGDVALLLCNRRVPYEFEDSQVLNQSGLEARTNRPAVEMTPDLVLRRMNHRTVALLNSLNTQATFALSETDMSKPKIQASVAVGEISIFASKDSFAVLSQAIGELGAEAGAIDVKEVERLQAADREKEIALANSASEGLSKSKTPEVLPQINLLEDLKRRSELRPTAGTANSKNSENAFLLDGYDWTTIDQDEQMFASIPPGEEQASRWYGPPKSNANGTPSSPSAFRARKESNAEIDTPINVITHHFPIRPDADPLEDGDMGAAKFAETKTAPPVQTRLFITDFALKLRLFDGYDWPESLPAYLCEIPRQGSFLTDLEMDETKKFAETMSDAFENCRQTSKSQRKASLMAGLLEGQQESSMFTNLPLSGTNNSRLREEELFRRLGRRSDKYLQISLSGLQLRSDSMVHTSDHRLASCLSAKIQDFFVAETISSNKPIKMAGEWFSDTDHPRDTNDGLLMIKIVTWHPERRVSLEKKLVNDECEAAVKILPLLCNIDQKATRFAGIFFRSDDPTNNEVATQLPDGLYSIPPPRFRKFLVKPFKLKVNYNPQKIDRAALRDGQIVELLNLSPLDSLVLTLQQVVLEDIVGLGDVISILVPTWIQDVSSTQLLKFVSNARPFEPISNISGGFADMLVLPWEAFKNGESFQKALRAGASSFVRALAYESLTISASLTERLAATVSETTIGNGYNESNRSSPPLLPSRPLATPTGMHDTATHALESLSRGLQTANAKIIIIPFREFQKNGTTGAVQSVIKGIPVAVAAPAGGAAEALSFALLGVRNQMYPDIRKEEEVGQRGLCSPNV